MTNVYRHSRGAVRSRSAFTRSSLVFAASGQRLYKRGPRTRRERNQAAAAAIARACPVAVGDVEEQARHLALAADGPERAGCLAPRGGGRARGNARGTRRGGRVVRARRRSDASRSRPVAPAAPAAANLHRLGDGERAVAVLEQLREEVGRSGARRRPLRAR